MARWYRVQIAFAVPPLPKQLRVMQRDLNAIDRDLYDAALFEEAKLTTTGLDAWWRSPLGTPASVAAALGEHHPCSVRWITLPYPDDSDETHEEQDARLAAAPWCHTVVAEPEVPSPHVRGHRVRHDAKRVLRGHAAPHRGRGR